MKHRLFDFYASKSWAILPDSLQEMYDIYRAAIDRKALDVDFDPEAVSARTGTRLDNTRRVEMRGDGVAIIPVMGPIFGRANLFTEISGATSIEMLAKDYNQARENPRVKAIIVHVNSPGGEVDGTSEFAQHVFDTRGEKPVVAYVAHLGASAAYWIASATDEIVANDTASVGSIGVVGSVSLDKDKKSLQFVSSQSPNKRPDPETEKGRSQIQRHIDDLAEVFIDTIARNRGWTAEQVTEKGGAGDIQAARRAVDSGLADRIGSLEGLIAELSDPKNREARLEKINKKKMLSISRVETDADSQTIGANEMADEKDKTPEQPKADAKPDAQDAKPDAVKGKPAEANAEEVEALKADKATAEESAKQSAAALALEQQKREALENRVAAMEKDARATRFTELAKAWSGDKTFHADMLEHLATTDGGGEQSERFKAYVTQQNAVAEQLRQSGLFREIGSNGHPVSDSAQEQVSIQAKALMAKDPKLSLIDAMKQVFADDPGLHAKYSKESAVRV